MRMILTAVAALCLVLSLVNPVQAAPRAPSIQPLNPYTNQTSITIRGQAQASTYVFVDGGTQRARTLAGTDGTFAVSVTLKPNLRNNLSVFASTDAEGDDHNSSRVHVAVVSDDIAPQIRATIDPAPNSAGWNRRPVQVKFTCTDSGSGIVACPRPVEVSDAAAGQIVTGEVKDNAGNSAALSVTVNIDTTAPRVVLELPADGALIYNSPAQVSGLVEDTLSGVSAVN